MKSAAAAKRKRELLTCKMKELSTTSFGKLLRKWWAGYHIQETKRRLEVQIQHFRHSKRSGSKAGVANALKKRGQDIACEPLISLDARSFKKHGARHDLCSGSKTFKTGGILSLTEQDFMKMSDMSGLSFEITHEVGMASKQSCFYEMFHSFFLYRASIALKKMFVGSGFV